MLRSLQALAQAAGPEDSVLVYYAGHGHRDTQGDASYWVPIGAAHDDSTDWVSAGDLNVRINHFNARHILVVSDSCFSGTMVMRGGPPAQRPSAAPREERQRYIAREARRSSRNLLASGADEPVADEGGSGHSVFARALLDALRDYDDKVFTATDLFARVRPAVGGKAAQMPQYLPLRQSGHDGGDFVFVRKSAGPAADR